MSAAAREGFLERMAAASRARVRAARTTEPEARLLARAAATPPAPPLVLESFDVIAELKLRSPAAGALRAADFDRRAQLRAYADAGVACVSVLTEPDEFRGSLAHLAEAAETLAPLGRPIMRKDFLTDPYQVLEARAAGAGGVLVILTMLSDADVSALIGAAREHGLFVLLETFDEDDLARIPRLGIDLGGRFDAGRSDGVRAGVSDPAGVPDRDGGPNPAGVPDLGGVPNLTIASAPILVGVNCRDLKTLRVDFRRFATLAPHLPVGCRAVAESGISSAADASAVAKLGYSLALVGSSLMQAADPARAAVELIAAGRSERPCS